MRKAPRKQSIAGAAGSPPLIAARARLLGSSGLCGSLCGLVLLAGVALVVPMALRQAQAADFATGGGVINAPSGNATAVGDTATTTGVAASAFGRLATANGSFATALGANSTANGGYATATGVLSVANGDRATATGQKSQATGNDVHGNQKKTKSQRFSCRNK